MPWFAIILIMVMQFEANPLDGIEIFDQFDADLQLFMIKFNMW